MVFGVSPWVTLTIPHTMFEGAVPASVMAEMSQRKPVIVHGKVAVMSVVLTWVPSSPARASDMMSLSIGRFAARTGVTKVVTTSPVRARFDIVYSNTTLVAREV